MPRATRSINTKKPTLSKNASLHSTNKSSSKTSNDYVEIRLPKVRFQDSPLSPLWVILLVIFAFLLGMTTTKLQYLQKGISGNSVAGPQAGNQPAPQNITMDTVKQWAKDLRLNSNKFNDCVDKQTFKDKIDKDLSDAIAASAEATPTFYINGVRIVGAVPYPQFKAALEAALTGATTDQTDTFTVDTGHLPMLGKDSAKVSMVEFSDLQCPFCLRFFQDTFPQIKKDYIDTGKIKFYYRHLPLASLHPMAVSFANAAECANDQGKFWQMHDKIFTEQEGQS